LAELASTEAVRSFQQNYWTVAKWNVDSQTSGLCCLITNAPPHPESHILEMAVAEGRFETGGATVDLIQGQLKDLGYLKVIGRQVSSERPPHADSMFSAR
jgi:hypothetical protein